MNPFRSIRYCGSAFALVVISACVGDPVAPSDPAADGPDLAAGPQAAAAFQGGCNGNADYVTAFNLIHTALPGTTLRVTHPGGMDRLRLTPDAGSDLFGACTAFDGNTRAHGQLDPIVFPDGGVVSIILKTPIRGAMTLIAKRRTDGTMRGIVKYEWDTTENFMVVVTRNGATTSSASGAGQVGVRLPPNFRLYEWDFDYNAGAGFLRGLDHSGNIIEMRAVVLPQSPPQGLSSVTTKFKGMGSMNRFYIDIEG